MKFDVLSWMFNPFVLMFFAVVTGMLFGKIKFGKFNFGVSGTLFSGLAIGYIVLDKAKSVAGDETAAASAIKSAGKLIKAQVVSKDFFFLFLILFVAAVGLLAAKDIGAVLKKYGLKFVALGFIITFLGATANYGMTLLLNDASPYEVAGVYTGALTSSPGLAAAIETARDHSAHWADDYENLPAEEQQKLLHLMDKSGALTPENTPTLTDEQKAQFVKDAEAGISVGHVIGYPFGVIIVILAMNFFPKIFKIDVEKEQEIFNKEMAEARSAAGGKVIEETTFDLVAFCLACLVGYTLGKFKIYLGPIIGYFSLGSTGGVLIGSLLLGYIGKIGFINFRMNSKILGVVRQLSLAFFLAVVGLRYGFKVVDALMGSGIQLAGVSLVVGAVAMMIGFAIGRYVFKINWIMLSGAICGGMTSTPGLGAAVDAVGSDDPAAGYGATYPFALLGMVLFTIILHKLPV